MTRSSRADDSSTDSALARGRGEGWRRALAERAVGAVIACVLDDRRWDRQCEQRERYYATLLCAQGADIAPLRDVVLDERDRAPADDDLPRGVLVEMALRGQLAAVRTIEDGLAGRWWPSWLEALGWRDPDAVVAAVSSAQIAALVARVGIAAIDDVVAFDGPWRRWAEQRPELGIPLAAPSAPWPDPVPIDPELSNAALYELAMHDPRRRFRALQLLGARGCLDYQREARAYFASAEPGITRDGRSWRRAYERYLAELPASATLALGRAWFHGPWPRNLVGHAILARHAAPEDRAMLEQAAAAALAAGDMYTIYACLDALVTIGDPASVPVFCAVHDRAQSIARSEAIAALAPYADRASVRARLVDALWDCEDRARLLACEHLDASDAPERFASLAADVHESDDIRAAARRAIDAAD